LSRTVFIPTSILFLFGFVACRSISIGVPEFAVPAPQPGQRFTAGRAKVDITPPPGYPMMGHSIAGRVARGYWTRLYARAFFFRDAQGQRLALVSCDLAAIPEGLHLEVARRLSAEKTISLPPEALILAATHTHHAPGGFYSAPLYNQFGSPWPGFDPELFDFLAGQISEAVTLAAKDADSASSRPHRLVLRSGIAPDIVRNRSINAFFRNSDHEAFLAQNAVLTGGCVSPTDPQCLRYCATDPRMTVLEVRRGSATGGDRIGLLVFFAVHATAMSHESPLYSSDLTGHAMTALEKEFSAGENRLLAGFFNGAQGDISPRWVRQNRQDVVRLGDQLAGAVREILNKPGENSMEDAPSITVIGGSFQANPPGPETAGLAARPMVGVAALGGAEDGRTLLYHYGWHAGVRRAPRKDQGVKVPALDLPRIKLLRRLRLTKLLSRPGSFPRRIPISLVRLGHLLTVGAIPAEMTTTMGKRIQDRMTRLEPSRRFVLVGLANEYISYVTTPEEYEAQDYEGASTLFGPQTGPVIGRLLEELSRKNPSPLPRSISSRKFKAGTKPLLAFGPSLAGERRDSLDEDLEPLMSDATGRLDCRTPRFEWDEPRDSSGQKKKDREATARRVVILEEQNSRWAPRRDGFAQEDDTGSNLLTVLVEGVKGRRWGAIWLPPLTTDSEKHYMFRVETAAAGSQCSKPFTLSMPKAAPTAALERGVCPDPSLGILPAP